MATGFSQATKDLVLGALYNDHERILAALANGADASFIYCKDEDDKTICQDEDDNIFCLLAWAAYEGHANLVRDLIEFGLPVDGAEESPITPLQCAVSRGHVQVVRELLSRGASLEAKDKRGRTALHNAVKLGHLSCMKLLLDAGADPNSQDDEGQSPLHLAVLVNSACIMMLVGTVGCNRHAVDKHRHTALHIAAVLGNLEAAKLLVEAGLDLEAKNADGLTPYYVAKASGQHVIEFWLGVLSQPEAVAEALMLTRPDPVAETPTLTRPEPVAETLTEELVAAVVHGDQERVLTTIAQGANTSIMPWEDDDHKSVCLLTRAAAEGHAALVPLLLAAGLPVNGAGESCTPLYYAAKCGHNEVVRELIIAQSSLEATDKNGHTALHLATLGGHQSCVQTLLDAGADLNCRNTMGWSPLHWAALGNYANLVALFVRTAGCNCHAVDKYGNTALHMAAMGLSIETAQWLAKAGLNPEAKNSESRTPLDEAELAVQNFNAWCENQYLLLIHDSTTPKTLPSVPAAKTPTLPQPDPVTHTSIFSPTKDVSDSIVIQPTHQLLDLVTLVTAVEHGDKEQVRVALMQGADSSVFAWRDTDGKQTCLLTRAAYLGHADLVPLLVEAGLPVDGTKNSNTTPLIFAAQNGHHQVVEALVKEKANLEARDNFGCTALLVAAREGTQSCVETLLQAGADPNARSYKGLSPLHFAALNKQIEIVRLLVNTPNCDRHATDKKQRTALHMAASSGALEEMQYLVLDARLDLNARDNKGYTPRDEARLAGQHLTEWWLKKTPRSDLAADIPQLEIMRWCWEQNELHFKDMVKEITAGNYLNLSVNIPNNVYGHQQDATGRTLLHWAAALGMMKAVKVLLEECRVYAHVMTWAGETPSDLALQAGHHQLVIWSGLHQLPLQVVEQQLVKRTQIMQGALHAESQQFMLLGGQYQLKKDVQLVNVKNTFSDVDSQEQQYYILLFVISQCDDVRWAVDLLEKGSPLEPVGGLAISALCSAVTSNRPRIVSLLVAAGAPLSTTSHGLNLLTLAWCSPDVTPRLQAIITSVFLNVLQHEHDTIKDLPDLDRGVHHLISTIKGEKPWLARWPRNESVMSLTELMVQAARANCTLTCSFLYLAGAQASLCSKASVSPLHAALETKHWKLAGHMVKTMRGCLYVADPTGRRPTTLLPSDHRQALEMSIYRKERHQLQELQEKTKNETVKGQVEEILKVQEVLFSRYWSDTTGKKNTMTAKSQEMPSGSQALLLASRCGLVQLIYLLVKVGGLAVDKPVDPTNDTTALHQAASCGKSCVIILLLNLGAQPLLPDRYGQTPPHLAAMFGHEHAFQLFAEFHRENIPYCKAGTSPQEVRRHYTKRLKIYKGCKFASELNVRQINNDQRQATENLLRHINFENLVEYTREATVDYKNGESKDVKDAVVKEIQQIISKIETDIYKGNIKLVGSAADGTRLYYPDEFDFNFILEEIPGIKANIKQQTKEEVIVSGHKLKVELQTENTSLHGNNLISNFFERVRDCLKSYTFVNKQLSLVPPGLTRTQVGVALTLAWQGSEYPLLIIGVDLVPVISVPWPEEIHRPPLTPSGLDTVHLSNTEDRGGSYICSFAATEVEVLANLDPQERQVYLTCKTLLSRMKAEPWMPKDMRNLFYWWDSRFWKIPTPEGFCLKNSFLKQVEKKRREGIKWQEDIISLVMSVFKEMCLEIVDEEPGSSSFVPNKVNAYFGGDCARPKVGEGAPEIVNFLKKISLT